MLIDLSDVLSEQHKPLDRMVPVKLQTIRIHETDHPVSEKGPAHIQVEHQKGKELRIHAQAKLSVTIPCDRCLEDVRYCFDLDFEKRVDLGRADAELTEGLDESNFIDGTWLDADLLLFNEILTEWPVKVLCREDCRGICRICGCNLNEGTCGCEDSDPDPRMSAIRDVFQNFKEV